MSTVVASFDLNVGRADSGAKVSLSDGSLSTVLLLLTEAVVLSIVLGTATTIRRCIEPSWGILKWSRMAFWQFRPATNTRIGFYYVAIDPAVIGIH
jgi:hypothetical protein